ncbi:MAG TPA: hypothetical protein VFF04_01770, partial [Candidatus Babeliales bacterium]|nr:hypothetical protein [Candidatus Babeliales bacterium]
MNLLAPILVFSCFSIFCFEQTIAPDYVVKGNFHDIAMYLGEDYGSGDLTFTLMDAICQNSFPIIVSRDMFQNFVVSNNDPQSSYSQVPFTDDDWLIYVSSHASKDYFLLLPKQYYEAQNRKFPMFKHSIKTKIGKKQFSYSRKEIISGFAIDHSDICRQIYLRDYKPGSKVFNELQEIPLSSISNATFTRFFIQGKDAIFGVWNIYILGHGDYPKIKLDQPLPNIIQETHEINTLIAGLSLSNFRSLIQLCIKNISTNFLYYMSCYASDANLILPYITYALNSKGNIVGGLEKPNFTIAVGSLTSEVVRQQRESYKHCTPERYTDQINVGNFFDQLHNFSNTISNQPTIFKDAELIKILSPLYPKLNSIQWRKMFPSYFLRQYIKIAAELSEMPQIIFPKTDMPKALPLSDDVSVITKTVLTRHILENKPIELDNKKAALLYPEKIDINVHVNSRDTDAPAIVSMLPGIGLHYFTSLTTTFHSGTTLWDYCFNFINPQFTKYFFFEQVNNQNALNPQEQNMFNMLIRNFANGSFIIFTDVNNMIYFVSVKSRAEQETNKRTIFTQAEDLNVNFDDVIKNNPLANALYNYRSIDKKKFDFDTIFNWKLLQTVISKEDRELIEKHIKAQESTNFEPTKKIVSRPTK